MSDFGDAAEAAIIQHLTGEATWGAVAQLYLQIHDGAPGEDGLANVNSDFGARAAVSWGAEAGGVAATDTDVELVNGGAGVSTASHVSYFDALTGGNCEFQGPMTTPKDIDPGDTLRFLAGALTIAAQ